MRKNIIISMLFFLLLVGCAVKHNVYVDGMPISDLEYFTTTPSGLKSAFVLARYYKKTYGDEYILYPEYLDILKHNDINSEKTEKLIIHVKVVNIKEQRFIVWYKLINSELQNYKMLYNGILPRKDFYIELPMGNGLYEYELVFNADKEELFRVDGSYQMKGGEISKRKDS